MELNVTQYLRPYGRTTTTSVPVENEIGQQALAAKLILSAEVLTTGQIAIYGRHPHQEIKEEIIKIAENGPGPNSPVNTIEQLIKELCKKEEER